MSLPSLNKVIIIIIIIKNPYYVLLKARGTLHMKGVGMLVGNFELNP